MTQGPDLATIIRTLLVDGFHLDTFRRSHGHVILNLHRYDRFGVVILYSVALFDEPAHTTALQGFFQAVEYERRRPLVVAPAAAADVYFITPERFLSLLGGAVDHSLIRHPHLADVLDSLGRQKVAEGMVGDPEELLEDAVAGCLQFLTGQRARRWGIDRRFEALPDGVLPGALVLLYDAKSYSDPYAVNADDMRRFADYVNDFNGRYGAYLGNVYSFVIVAGEFAQDEHQRERRSLELYAACRSPLCYVTARTLGTIVEIVRERPHLRPAMDWGPLVATPTLTTNLIDAEMRRLTKDNLLPHD